MHLFSLKYAVSGKCEFEIDVGIVTGVVGPIIRTLFLVTSLFLL